MGRLWELVQEIERERREAPAVAVDGQLDLLGRHLTPRERLSRYLDTWATMDETTWTEANVKALYDDIMDIFRDHPREADTWFRAWRLAHPEARLR